jgi:hypothetical protein
MGNRNLILDGAEGVTVAAARVKGRGEIAKTKKDNGEGARDKGAK